MEKSEGNMNSARGDECVGMSNRVYQGMATGASCVVCLLTSMAMGYTSTALPSMRADPHFTISRDEESWVGAVIPATAMLGSLVAGPLCNHLGRRHTLLYLFCPFLLGWVLIATAGSVSGVIVGRMLCGTCVGMGITTRMVLMPEMIQFDLRKHFFPLPPLATHIGILLTFAAGQLLGWRGLAWLGAALTFPMLPLLLPLPETPYHLTRTGRREESLAALKMLRCSTEEAEKEQQQIDRSCSSTREDSTQSSVWQLTTPPNSWPVGVAMALLIAQQTTGITAVYFFAPAILDTGGDGQKTGWVTVVLGLINLLGYFVGKYGIRHFKRRRLLQISSRIVVTSLLTLSLLFWAQDSGGAYAAELARNMNGVRTVALLTYVLGMSTGWIQVPWVFIGEGMPSWVRGQATAVVTAVYWATAFLVSKTFMWSLATVGAGTTFLGYAVVTAISGYLIIPVMPETYRQTTDQMNQLYLDAAEKKKQ